jgi:predicted nucleic acid-binding protein
MKALIDTNVVLDALMRRNPWADAAERIIVAAASDMFTACVTASGITDIYYLVQKHLQDRRKTRDEVRKLFDIFDVLDVTGSDCISAFDIGVPDYEDALLAQCARRAKADLIVTRNENDFSDSPVPAVSPQEFLAKMGEVG